MIKQRQLKSFVHTVRITSKDIGMEFGMDKCSTIKERKGNL